MDQEQRTQLGGRIRQAREDKGWSQAKLASEAGVSENTILSIEGAKRTPQDSKLRAVLDALGMATPPNDVLDLEGVPEDVRIFLTVAALRLKVLNESQRNRVLSDIYPRLLLAESGE